MVLPPVAPPAAVFHALADETRLRVIERLGDGPAATTVLAEPFDMALPSFTQHLEVLARSGLVSSSKSGRVRTWRLEPGRMAEVEGWMAGRRRVWERRLDRLDDHLATMKEQT